MALLSLTAGLERSASGLIRLGRADFGLFQGGLADLTASALPESLVDRVRRETGVREASPAQIVSDALPGSGAAIGTCAEALRPGEVSTIAVAISPGYKQSEAAKRLEHDFPGTVAITLCAAKRAGISARH